MIEKKCMTDDDCDLELICNDESNRCTCPKSYFWRDDIDACFGCAPGWLELERSKCLLFAISHSPGFTWYEAQTNCKTLISQSVVISTTDEFVALQRRIGDILNGSDALTATLYFHQGAWVQVENDWNESYIWCNNKKEDYFDCIQIRQNSITNTICLQYVSCFEKSHYICEASPLIQSELERNMADAERPNVRDQNEKIMIRVPIKTTLRFTTARTIARTTVRTTIRTTVRTTVRTTIKQTTKKGSSININGIANVLTDGINAYGQISNALGNVQAGNTNQNSNQQNNLIENSNNQINPLALESNDDKTSKINIKTILLYTSLTFGGIILLIIPIICIIIFLKKKKNTFDSKSSIKSLESYSSDISNE